MQKILTSSKFVHSVSCKKHIIDLINVKDQKSTFGSKFYKSDLLLQFAGWDGPICMILILTPYIFLSCIYLLLPQNILVLLFKDGAAICHKNKVNNLFNL
jgi:hypothetical protein